MYGTASTQCRELVTWLVTGDGGEAALGASDCESFVVQECVL